MDNEQKPDIRPGKPLPLGAHAGTKGTQFSLFSRNALSVSLLLFESDTYDSRYSTLPLDRIKNRTGDIWHIWVEGITHGQIYGYKIDGPYDPGKGHRFNRNKLLVDPFARAITDNYRYDLTQAKGFSDTSTEKDLSFSSADSVTHVPKSIVIGLLPDKDDRPLNIPPEETIVYELHVKGFTCHESSRTAARGTYAGIIEKIPYLKDLGITSVELLPIQEFDDDDNIFFNPVTGEKLKNYWGYSTFAFFAPKGTYAKSGPTGHQVEEFKGMVKGFHDAGMEVILDVVFNHTAEGDQNGPTISFRGIDNSIYYILEDNRRFYKNYSGCGNTFNCNHPLVREFILDCLRYWVIEMKIDGFRFDLASILGRDMKGNLLSNPPLIEKIEEDPILRNTKIIAEAWDAAGAYQVGNFPGRWAEWNGKYRDDVRKFWRGDPGSSGNFATRVTGSSDLYHSSLEGPCHSINFITCHDGFTMNDLVSFNEKHNHENGEENRDGENYNLSWNLGIEGLHTTPFIEEIRLRQIKNFIATLFLSQGIPMLLAGDEFRRTQKGNNNAYCQDNEISWIDWGLLEKNREIFNFTKEMITFRKNHPILRKKSFFSGEHKQGFSGPDISWHGWKLNRADWSGNSHTVAFLINGEYSLEFNGKKDSDIYIIFNASMISRYFQIPDSFNGKKWLIAVDTSIPAPGDIIHEENAPELADARYYVKKLSTVVLVTTSAR